MTAKVVRNRLNLYEHLFSAQNTTFFSTRGRAFLPHLHALPFRGAVPFPYRRRLLLLQQKEQPYTQTGVCGCSEIFPVLFRFYPLKNGAEYDILYMCYRFSAMAVGAPCFLRRIRLPASQIRRIRSALPVRRPPARSSGPAVPKSMMRVCGCAGS